MPENNEHLEKTELEESRRHGHLCLLYESEAEILAPVIPFIQKGVALGERCIYLNAGEEMLDRVLKNTLSGQKSELAALVLLPAQETWLQGGGFDADRMVAQLQSLCSSAAGDGFKGTRFICDMGWAAGLKKDFLVEFERGLNLFAARHEATLLCLYNRGSFPPEQLLELAREHPQLMIGGKLCNNPLYLPKDRIPGVSRATSELDLFLAAAQAASGAATDRERLRQDLEQAYAALARKIYENWQEEDTLRASEKELVEKEEALLEHRRRLQTILQHLPVVLVALDGANRLSSCNHEFERVTGFRAEEVMGKPLLEVIEVADQGREELLRAHPPEGGDYRGMEWSLRCKDASQRRVSWSNFSRYVTIAGWPNWLIGLDVTPRTQAELHLRTLKDEVKARTGELEALGQAVSRDLGSQIDKISSRCSILQELPGAALEPLVREVVQEIHQATREMSQGIAALQRFSKLAAGELHPERVDLSAMAAEIAARLRRRGGERRVIFSIEEGVTTTGDQGLLRFAMEQLLENAWNSSCGAPHPMIRFGTVRVEGETSFFVSDNGPRPNEASSVVREPGSSNSPGLDGAGIGLATVQRILSRHRGRIWAADEAGPGATFYFRV
jgi:PAS domain S-box-containing protein